MTTPGRPPKAIKSAAIGSVTAWSLLPTPAISSWLAKTLQAARQGWRVSGWRLMLRNLPACWRPRASLPTKWGQDWVNTLTARCRIGRGWWNRKTLPGYWPLMHAMRWRGSRLRTTPRRWRRYGGRLKKRSAFALKAKKGCDFFTRHWYRRCSTVCFPPGCYGRANAHSPRQRLIGARRFGICARPSCKRCSNSYHSPVGCNRLVS